MKQGNIKTKTEKPTRKARRNKPDSKAENVKQQNIHTITVVMLKKKNYKTKQQNTE